MEKLWDKLCSEACQQTVDILSKGSRSDFNVFNPFWTIKEGVKMSTFCCLQGVGFRRRNRGKHYCLIKCPKRWWGPRFANMSVKK